MKPEPTSQQAFYRPEHRAVAAVLRAMDPDLLIRCGCSFGGGTAIVLTNGEYRLSKDIDFLCSNVDGYRELRSIVTREGTRGLFRKGVDQEREFRSDQYGLRAVLRAERVALRFEIIREGRITLDGGEACPLGVPMLSAADQVAEKLLANADRANDASTAFRDAIDLGMLVRKNGRLPQSGVAKAASAYADVGDKAIASALCLADSGTRRRVETTLGMTPNAVGEAARSIARACWSTWPDMARERSLPRPSAVPARRTPPARDNGHGL